MDEARWGAVFQMVLPRKDERVFPPMVSVSPKGERAIVVFLLISAHKYNIERDTVCFS